ncbi:MAG: SET domain-containing protein-lysine N-methyltransferase [Candidatus Edwardsbacteria bacterium]|nr:SET domain-containing protein-lysine N-methyltransferase [Candidatus Edwardsbacteria bacterium]
MTQRAQRPDSRVSVRPSAIHGRGVFAERPFRKRRKLGEIAGRIIGAKRALRQIARQKRIYFVQLDERHGLDCSRGNEFYLRIIRHRVEVYALRNIRRGEELTIDYGQTPHRAGMECRCGAARCKGRI